LIEYALVNGTGNSGASGTARTLKGVLSFISTNNVTGTGTGAEAFSEGMFNEGLQAIWDGGGRPDVAYVNGSQKRAISALTTSNVRYADAKDGEIYASVSVFDSDFGRIKIVLDRFMPNDKVAILQSDLWAVATLRPTKKVDVAKVGSATRGVVETELTLEARNQGGNGLVTGLS
jgi:hypothetical protein